MAKCPDALIKHIEKHSEWFENIFIACVRQDLKFFDLVKNVVCLKSGSQKKHMDDFDNPFNNIIYRAIRDYNSIFEKSPSVFSPIKEDWLKGWLLRNAHSGEIVMESEIPEVIDHFNNNIAKVTAEAHTLQFAKQGISSYLKARRASKIARQVSLSGLNIDDLALMCEENVDLISTLEEDKRIVQSVPDRIQIQDMPLFDDPNKMLVETLECDIPGLNEAMGGGFRKGSAYMLMAGTGGGKTVFACQIAATFAYVNGAVGLFISTEQSSDELYRRIVSNRCRIPHRAISKGIFESSLNTREMEAFIEFRKNVAKLNKGCLQFANWGNYEKKAGSKILSQIESEMDIFEEESGKKTDFVILDWIGGALGSMAEAGDKTRHVYQEAADAMDELARKRNVVAIALAQAHVSSANKIQISAADLAECKSMTRNYAGVIGITSLYSEEYARQMHEEKNKKKKDYRVGSDLDDAVSFSTKQYLYVSKARFGIQKAVPFKREYEFQRMEAWT
jgi:replicative DNA helicase